MHCLAVKSFETQLPCWKQPKEQEPPPNSRCDYPIHDNKEAFLLMLTSFTPKNLSKKHQLHQEDMLFGYKTKKDMKKHSHAHLTNWSVAQCVQVSLRWIWCANPIRAKGDTRQPTCGELQPLAKVERGRKVFSVAVFSSFKKKILSGSAAIAAFLWQPSLFPVASCFCKNQTLATATSSSPSKDTDGPVTRQSSWIYESPELKS